jgi:hypothetical protein
MTFMKLYSALALLCTSFSLAQTPPPNPPGPPPAQPQPFPPNGQPLGAPNGPDSGPGGRSGRPFVDMMRQRYDGKGGGMDQLNEEDRKRLRSVMEKVWSKDEVKTARDAAADAAKKYRDVMHEAAIKEDPSLAPLLEKIKANMERVPMGGPGGPGGPGFSPGQPSQPGQPGQPGQPNPDRPKGPPNGPGPGAGPGPGPEDPSARSSGRGEAGRGEGTMRLFGLEPAELQKLPEDQRGRLREAFEKIMQNPEVKAAREAAEKADGEGKREAFRKMRDVVKTVAEKEFPELAKIVERLRSQAGSQTSPGRTGREGRPPQEEPAPAPPPASGQAPPANTPGAPENAPPK